MFIVVLGGGIDLSGNLPSHVYQRLNKAIEIFKQYPKSKIILSGKYSFLYKDKKPPTTEAAKMKQYLLEKSVSAEHIYLEQLSKDTIGNAYYLKKYFFIPGKEKEAMVITSHYHLKRVQYIFDKIFGSSYSIQIVAVQENLSVNEEKKVIQRQKELLAKTQTLLLPMKNGDHDYLKRKIYNFKYYREKRSGWIINFVAKGK